MDIQNNNRFTYNLADLIPADINLSGESYGQQYDIISKVLISSEFLRRSLKTKMNLQSLRYTTVWNWKRRLVSSGIFAVSGLSLRGAFLRYVRAYSVKEEALSECPSLFLQLHYSSFQKTV